MLYRLMYCSTANGELSTENLEHIREVSIENNRKCGITGVLAFANGYFIQTIEGGAREVNATFARIQKNDQHRDTFILSYSPIVSRLFTNFEMEIIAENEDNRAIFFKYSSGNGFDPYDFDPQAAELLLSELMLAAK